MLNCWQIKNIIHYLIKWVTWFSEYNFYESAAHLAKTSEVIATFEWKFKCKQNEFKDAVSDKQAHHTDWFDINFDLILIWADFDFWFDFDFDFDFVQTLSE